MLKKNSLPDSGILKKTLLLIILSVVFLPTLFSYLKVTPLLNRIISSKVSICVPFFFFKILELEPTIATLFLKNKFGSKNFNFFSVFVKKITNTFQFFFFFLHIWHVHQNI